MGHRDLWAWKPSSITASPLPRRSLRSNINLTAPATFNYALDMLRAGFGPQRVF